MPTTMPPERNATMIQAHNGMPVISIGSQDRRIAELFNFQESLKIHTPKLY